MKSVNRTFSLTSSVMTEAARRGEAMDGGNEQRRPQSRRGGLVKINGQSVMAFYPRRRKNDSPVEGTACLGEKYSVTNPVGGVKKRLGDQSPKNEKMGGLKK